MADRSPLYMFKVDVGDDTNVDNENDPSLIEYAVVAPSADVAAAEALRLDARDYRTDEPRIVRAVFISAHVDSIVQGRGEPA